MKYCTNCGAQIDDHAAVCVHCGSQVAPSGGNSGYHNGPNGYGNPGYHNGPNGYGNPGYNNGPNGYGNPGYNNGPDGYGNMGGYPAPPQYVQPRKQQDSTMSTVILVFLIIGCISVGWAIIPLAWCIPITVMIHNRMKNGEEVGIALKILALLFVNLIAGICLLCSDY